MKKWVAFLIGIVMAVPVIAYAGGSFTSDYNYNQDILFINESGADISQPLLMPVNAPDLIAYNYIQADADDVAIQYLGLEEYVTARDLSGSPSYWRLEYTDIPAGNSIKKTFWFGNASGTRNQAWIASGSDTCTITHSGSFNFGNNAFMLSCEITPTIIPDNDQVILEKPNQYKLALTSEGYYKWTVWDNQPADYSASIAATAGSESTLYCWYTGGTVVISDRSDQSASSAVGLPLNSGTGNITLLVCDAILNDLRLVQE